MRVLGPALITPAQQKMLAEGAVLEIGRGAAYASAAKRARIGDVFWVREPYIEFIPAQFGCPANIGAFLPGFGPKLYAEKPAYLKPYAHLCRRKQHLAQGMTRSLSRASLEITAILHGNAGWLCKAKMGNVDGLESNAA
jgi:hypothetical protein